MKNNLSLIIGFVLGLGVSLLLLVWAVPEFRGLEYAIEYYEGWDATSKIQKSDDSNEATLWLREFDGWITTDDSLAQWAMALAAIFAAAISAWAVTRVNETLNVTRNLGQKQVRAYLSFERGKAICSENETIKITCHLKNFGQSPAGEIDWVAYLNMDIATGCDAIEETAKQSSFDSIALAANQEIPIEFVFRNNSIRFDEFSSGKIRYSFIVLFRYTDVFNETHIIQAFSERNESGIGEEKELKTIHHQKPDHNFPEKPFDDEKL